MRKFDSLSDLPTAAQLRRLLNRKRYKKMFAATLWNTACSVMVAGAAAVLISALLLPVIRVTGTSMEPTVSGGQIVLCNKMQDAKCGDIIALYYNKKILLKRVIAVAGDVIELDSSGNVLLNGEDLFALYETTTAASETAPPDIVINSDAYCGYLEIPVLGLELPVQSGWSYPALKKSPCCYSGSAQTNDFIICAHNYPSHFGRLGSLTTDDRILFTDTAGIVHTYAVSGTEIIDGGAVTQMFSGQSEDWDLTLYTCTLGGQSRVTVRAYRVTDDADTPD